MTHWLLASATLSCLWLAGCSHTPAPSPAITAQTLLKTTSAWDGTPYTRYPDGQPELTMVKIVIAPYTELPWHTHPVPNAGYILSGELTVETRTPGVSRVLRQGDTIAETVGVIHRGVTGAQAAELIVFYAGVPAAALSQPTH